jgi:hypothetical protein
MKKKMIKDEEGYLGDSDKHLSIPPRYNAKTVVSHEGRTLLGVFFGG